MKKKKIKKYFLKVCFVIIHVVVRHYMTITLHMGQPG